MAGRSGSDADWENDWLLAPGWTIWLRLSAILVAFPVVSLLYLGIRRFMTSGALPFLALDLVVFWVFAFFFYPAALLLGNEVYDFDTWSASAAGSLIVLVACGALAAALTPIVAAWERWRAPSTASRE